MFRDLRADEIECRVAQIKTDQNGNATGVIILLYKDARCDQSILDETVGAMNWQRHHVRDNANCIVSIWDDSKNQWVDKEDTGTESNTEKEKGLASDSFKRACFNWGIGRELYTAPFIWITPDNCAALKKNNKGTWQCFDRFEVSSITIDNKRITGLSIKNAKTKKVVFQMGKEPTPAPKKPTPPQEPTPPPALQIMCERCGKKVTAMKHGGKVWTADEIAANSKAKYNSCLCWNCMKEVNAQQNGAEGQ